MQEEWTERHRPQSLSEIVGNELAVKTIRRWAESWRKAIPQAKALVLKGEPGTGKTSAALALARDMDWDFIEMNASDHRNAASIRKVAGAGSMGQAFAPTGEFLSSFEGKRKLVILDEADNLFGREDYGGAKEIVETIKNSAQPIILIVNDYSELVRKAPAIRNLCEKVVFRRLDKRSVVSVLKTVVEKENVKVPTQVLERIAENAGGDMRAAVNDLQMLVEGKLSLASEDSDAMGKRNQERQLDESLRAMYAARSLREARDAILDLDMTPDELEKWIEESIPQELRHSEDMALAFDALSKSDIYLDRTKQLQHYGLWAYAKEMMTGGVVLARTHGPRPGAFEYKYPSHFILMSRAKGPRASRDSISRKLAAYMHTSRRCVTSSSLPYISNIARNDEEFLIWLVRDLGLDEGDVAYLLGADPDSREVSRIMSQIRAPDVSRGGMEAGRTRSGANKRNLADF
ncbi:MAG: replication factor C large subunit [Thermoplasmata archaeon]